jgi:hypothetical protein
MDGTASSRFPTMSASPRTNKRDPPPSGSTTDKSVHTATAPLSDCSDTSAVAADDEVTAKSTLRSVSIPIAAVGSAVPSSMPVYKDQVLERKSGGSQRSAAGAHYQCGNRMNSVAAISNSPNHWPKDQAAALHKDALDTRPASTRVPVEPAGTTGSRRERLPVYKDQTSPGRDTDYIANAWQNRQSSDREAGPGGRVTDKDTLDSAGGTVPTGHDSFARPNTPSLTSTEIQEHLLVATVVPYSVAHDGTNSSDRGVVLAVPVVHASRVWKLLLGMVVIVLMVIAMIGSVCGTGGCFMSSPSSPQASMPPLGPAQSAVMHSGSPQSTMPSVSPQSTVAPAVSPQSTVAPTVSRAEPMPSFINNTETLGDWEFCLSSSQCRNECCSKQYSNDGKLKCTPLNGGGYNPDICVGNQSGLLGDWAFCSNNSQCHNGCCSSKYSNDNVTKCTPLSGGGFNADICTEL